MNKEVNIHSEEWCDLIFENRNKNYGAYHLRIDYWCGFMVTLVIFIITSVFIPINNNSNSYEFIPDEGCPPIYDIPVAELPELPLPPKVKSSIIRFTPPEITSDSLIIKMEPEDSYDKGILYEEGFFESSPELTSILEEEREIDIVSYCEDKTIIEEIPKQRNSASLLTAQEAQFPGGKDELYRFIATNIKYPYNAIEMGIEGDVIASFIIDKDGKIKDIEIISGLSYTCNKEVIRVIRLMPKWIPAMQYGRRVSMRHAIPVKFKLKEKNSYL
ncbi:energy transducer TonB [Dysgonomonas macrotermitis]|uniref:Protein TonB n=1 Tax=Dysgonomonas macrotermitis TaxID=1346286 RepID=A0A1M5BKK6_9BACT|nr:energy transducer TonB [Dysgonomonas macrotermitis]SHF43101.1 protein TonB [Dysgonomonas macrotermitis]